ncbi:hypothetical protein PHYSODRAFT_327729 [Phytophthora sojae]|uniref:Uncharacterized protein n=1 Tax=Phytophthora sojae (strain P6497) TaxID=1094619 RepID=G4Z528_PHYSP|nr:hypothetical protein PHYSODRAFT_327729 [Phytophthora sojae]EGZ19474.1 hypothetical protein PHYSODRAFT_327729 [Phytophthora sojae]|eukprot:XP_009522191.1 hypothetical protein PHYSODRAFT_327729 [Phytophthora sojae]
MLQRIRELRAQEDQARDCTTVEQLRAQATNPVEGNHTPVRATMRLYGKVLFARGVHLKVFDNCSPAEFAASSKELQSLTHSDQQSVVFRVTVWGASLGDPKFVVGAKLRLRDIRDISIFWHGILGGVCHYEDIERLRD